MKNYIVILFTFSFTVLFFFFSSMGKLLNSFSCEGLKKLHADFELVFM